MRCKILSQKKSELANFGYIKKVSWKIPVEKFFEYQKSLMAKNLPKTLWQKLPKNSMQKPAKNPLKIPCDKNLFISAKNFYEYFNIKILNNTKNFLISPNKTKNPSMNFELITAKYDCRCSLTGKNFSRGDQVYYNYEAKTFLDPVYHENIMSQQKSRGAQSYFERHKKLNKIYPNT